MKFFLPTLLLGLLMVACNKDEVKLTPLTSLAVVNTVAGGTSAKMGSNAATISNNNSTQFAMVAGNNDIYVYPVGDSANPYFDTNVTTNNGEIYTLFLGGTAAAPEGVLKKESIPYITDSLFGLRFINMSSSAPEVKVTLSTSSNGSEFADIAYKEITDFKMYQGKLANTSYTFQVRQASNDSLLVSQTISGTALTTGIPRFKNITLVLRGTYGGSPALGITRVNHY